MIYANSLRNFTEKVRINVNLIHERYGENIFSGEKGLTTQYRIIDNFPVFFFLFQ